MPTPLASSTRSLSYAAPPEAGRTPRLCVGTVVSYEAATHTCLVALDTAHPEVEIPAAGYLPAALLAAGAQVAVALFSANDPSDGLIIGPFGGSTPLTLEQITGAPAAGQVPIGTGTAFALAPLTGTPNRVSVASGTGSITLSAPQDLHTSATPTFGALNLGASAGAPAGQIKTNQNSISGDVVANLQNLSATGYGAYLGGGDASRYALRVGNYNGSNIALDVLGDGTTTVSGKLTAPAFQTTADAYTNIAASSWGAILTGIAPDSVYLIYAYNDYNGYYAFGIGMRLGVGAAVAIALSASGGLAFQGNGNNVEVYNAVAATRTIHFITTRLQ